MRYGGWYPTATRLVDGRVLITAGWDESGGGASANNTDIDLYTPAPTGGVPGASTSWGTRTSTTTPTSSCSPTGR
jgi:hypothetical protein